MSEISTDSLIMFFLRQSRGLYGCSHPNYVDITAPHCQLQRPNTIKEETKKQKPWEQHQTKAQQGLFQLVTGN